MSNKDFHVKNGIWVDDGQSIYIGNSSQNSVITSTNIKIGNAASNTTVNSTGFYIGGNTVGYGYTGSRGTLGYTGSIGYTGSTGAGYTGSASTVPGYTGSRGYSGSQGTIGYTGSGFQWKGNWTSGTWYYGGDGVLYNNNSYMCLSTNYDTAPTNPTYWSLLSPQGYTGSASTVIGYTGSRGLTGYTGSSATWDFIYSNTLSTGNNIIIAIPNTYNYFRLLISNAHTNSSPIPNELIVRYSTDQANTFQSNNNYYSYKQDLQEANVGGQTNASIVIGATITNCYHRANIEWYQPAVNNDIVIPIAFYSTCLWGSLTQYSTGNWGEAFRQTFGSGTAIMTKFSVDQVIIVPVNTGLTITHLQIRPCSSLPTSQFTSIIWELYGKNIVP